MKKNFKKNFIKNELFFKPFCLNIVGSVTISKVTNPQQTLFIVHKVWFC